MLGRSKGCGRNYLSALRQKAEQGNAEAQCFLGTCFTEGQGVPQDDKEAAKWYRLAADQGLADAQHHLGLAYFFGKGVPQNDKKSVEWFRLAVEQGHADAQFRLGCAFHLGRGVPKDEKEAVKWLRFAEEQGRAEARCSPETRVVLRDVKWLRLTAEQGFAIAQFNLGLAFDRGEGVPQDYTEAVKWYRLAAEKGLARAQFSLGCAYTLGQGVPQDYAQAYAWLNIAAAQYPCSVYTLAANSTMATPEQVAEGRRLSREYAEKFIKKVERAKHQGEARMKFKGLLAGVARLFGRSKGCGRDNFSTLQQKAEQGHADAQYNLGLVYDLGQEVPQDSKEAVKWFRLAAEQGHADAQYNLGLAYHLGTGVSHDDKEAVKWFGLASEQGHTGAQTSLDWGSFSL